MRFFSIGPAILALFIVLSSVASGNARQVNDPAAGLWAYSHLELNELEGEYNGLQVVIVPYDGGISVLWRSANGSFDKPLLLDARRNANTLTVVVPQSNQLSGTWTLAVQEKSMVAEGPRGLHFKLSRLSAK